MWRKRDLLDAAPGFDGMELIEDVENPDGHFLSWTPGMTPFEGFPGLAWQLHPGMDLVLEVHMVPSGKPEEVQPTIGLYFADRPPDRYPFEILLHSEEIDIPPGTADYHLSDSYVLPVEVEILGVHPHAHQIGKRMVAYATLPDGSRRSLLSIPQWDFNWQNVYRYAKPIVLPKATTLTMEFSYDNSSANPRNPHKPPQRIQYGFRTSDEMAQLSMQVLPRTEGDRAKLAEHFRFRELKATIKRNELLLRRSPDDAGLHAELGKARFVLGESEDARRTLSERSSWMPITAKRVIT